jgi:L-lactate dehydrogenase (cytochrome)/(S)-mandelate dehydrogenase
MAPFRFEASLRPSLLSVEDYRRAARRRLPSPVWAYIDGGAADQETLQQNRRAFSCWNLKARVLCGSKSRDLAVEIAGVSLALPVLLAPTGLAGLANWRGELGAAQEAERRGTRLVLSNAASYSMEELAAGTTEDHWFQLYPYYDREFIATVMTRAAANRLTHLFVTVDVPTYGNREVERRHGMDVPPILTAGRVLDAARRPRWCYGFLRHRRFTMPNLVDQGGLKGATSAARALHQKLSPDLSWDDLAWMRERWPKRLFVKGVLDPDDAERCVRLGVDGVVVSNHGGRQLDSCLPALAALPAVAKRIGGKAQILFDGGIRRGGDVIKALCLGADACLIGRPFLYGLAVQGPTGVADVLSILRTEIDRDLCLMGCSSVSELDSSWLLPTTGGHPTALPQPQTTLTCPTGQNEAGKHR